MNWKKEDFITKINQKEEEAFHQLFLQFRSYLVLFAIRRIGEPETAKDIVQDTFISVWESSKVYNSHTGLKAWLYELVHNKCLNYLKHKNVERKYLTYMNTREETVKESFDLTQEEIYRRLYLAVRELPDKCRTVFELHLEGRKNNEIADTLGISVLTVKAHKQNAIRLLKERMGNLLLLYLLLRKKQIG